VKKLHILLAALLLISLILPVQAAQNTGWKLEGGTLTITGQGAMADYPSAAAAPWYSRRSEIQTIVISDGITAIGSNSFTFCQNVTQVSLPAGLLSIGKNAFWGCESLTGISLPDSLEYMGTCAFFGSGLTAVTVPAGVSVLEQGVFAQCGQLKTAALPQTMAAIHKDAFSRCYSLQALNLPAALETVGEHAFFACVQLTELTFRENLSAIDTAAFYGCSKLKTLRFTGLAPKLADLAFLGITATVHYPIRDESWQNVAGNSYGGSITWADGCTHNYTSTFTEPTCESRGYTTYTCTICGHSYDTLFIDPLGHSFTQYISDDNATADTDGTKTAQCDRGCGQTNTVIDEGSRLPANLSSDIYRIEEETIHAVPTGTTAAQFCKNIHQRDIQLLKDGKPLADYDLVSTGTVVQLLRGAQVVRAWVVIVTGDLNGDGEVSISDMLLVKSHILNKTMLEGICAQAADTNGDLGISITDFIQIKAHILGKSQIEAK
jgi:hypothetical protein